MKRIRAKQIIENKVIKEFEHIDKLEEHIQYDLLSAITKKALDHKLIQVEKSNERKDPYGPTRYQIEIFVMSPAEFKEICIVLDYLKNHTLPFTARNCIKKLEKLIKDKK